MKKLDSTELDAIVLAAAGVIRLGLGERITAFLKADQMLPAVGQGALCIEIRAADTPIQQIVAALDDADTRITVTAERGFLNRLEGGCQVPIAAHASRTGDQLRITGLVAELDGSRIIKGSAAGPLDQAAPLGIRLAEELLARGADLILERLKSHAG